MLKYKKILFLHGFFATGSCSMAKVLKEAFEDTQAHFPPSCSIYSQAFYFPGGLTPTEKQEVKT